MLGRKKNKIDMQEIELPETAFIRDIEDRVFQGIVLQCLSTIKGISLIEGNFIDYIFYRTAPEGIKGIHTEQDTKQHTVSLKIEINIVYGEPIPEKAEEIQTKVTEEVTKMTGLHVSSVHVIFKDVVSPDSVPSATMSHKKETDSSLFQGKQSTQEQENS